MESLQLLQPKHKPPYAVHYSDWWTRLLRERTEQQYNNLVMHTGKPGRGKSWAGLSLCETMDENWDPEIQIVFNGRQFKNAMEKTKSDSWTHWDEPKGLSHRNWYREVNKAVTDYLQTFRFRKKNVVFAIPKASLIDKSARLVMTYECIFWTRAIASVYELNPNHFGSSPEIFKDFLDEVEYLPPSQNTIEVFKKKREEFHTVEFPEKAFDENLVKEQSERKYRSWQEVYAEIKKDPDRFRDPIKNNMMTALKVSSMTGCSDQTARKCLRKYAEERLNAQTVQGS